MTDSDNASKYLPWTQIPGGSLVQADAGHLAKYIFYKPHASEELPNVALLVGPPAGRWRRTRCDYAVDFNWRIVSPSSLQPVPKPGLLKRLMRRPA